MNNRTTYLINEIMWYLYVIEDVKNMRKQIYFGQLIKIMQRNSHDLTTKVTKPYYKFLFEEKNVLKIKIWLPYRRGNFLIKERYYEVRFLKSEILSLFR